MPPFPADQDEKWPRAVVVVGDHGVSPFVWSDPSPFGGARILVETFAPGLAGTSTSRVPVKLWSVFTIRRPSTVARSRGQTERQVEDDALTFISQLAITAIRGN